jgi:hypothetical protein
MCLDATAKTPRFFVSASSIGLLAIMGCSQPDYRDGELVGVTGTVTLNGDPLPAARVRFEDTDGFGAEGITDVMGEYRLMCDSGRTGCAPGRKQVRITLAGPREVGVRPDAVSGDEGGGAFKTLPAIYNTQTILTADVSASNRTFDFPLEANR